MEIEEPRDGFLSDEQYVEELYKNLKRRTSQIKSKYGMRWFEVDWMLREQGFECAICRRGFPKAEFHVDHCHITGKVRGLLCRPCNHAIGMLCDSQDSLQRAIDYLKADRSRLAAIWEFGSKFVGKYQYHEISKMPPSYKFTPRADQAMPKPAQRKEYDAARQKIRYELNKNNPEWIAKRKEWEKARRERARIEQGLPQCPSQPVNPD